MNCEIGVFCFHYREIKKTKAFFCRIVDFQANLCQKKLPNELGVL